MALDIKDILEIIDFSGDVEKATAEELQNHIHSVFVARKLAVSDPDIVNAVIGSTKGGLETKFNRLIKDLNIELADEDKSKKLDDKLDVLGAKINEKIKALEESGAKGNDEKATSYQKKWQEAEAKYKEESELRANVQKLLEETEKDKANTIKTYKLNSTLEKIKSEIPISEEAKKDKYKVKGFELEFNEKYELDLDENDTIVIKDKKTGLPVKNEKQTAHDTFENVYKRELMAAEMLKLNNSTESNTQTRTYKPAETQNNNNTGIVPNAKALQNAAELKAAAGQR